MLNFANHWIQKWIVAGWILDRDRLHERSAIASGAVELSGFES
jgi:hypothetical protein